MSGPTLLIDGDGLIYRAAAAVEREAIWDNERGVFLANLEEAYDAFLRSLHDKQRVLGARTYHIALTTKGNFRRDLSPTYKANRKSQRPPVCLADLRARVVAKHPCREFFGLEADDILGIWATNGKVADPIIVTDDKDLLTVPGKVYRQQTLHKVSVEEADYRFITQVLTGDSTDGYPGCPGIGPKTAEKILSQAEDHWQAVVATYEAKGLTADDALLQARLARILRASDWDANKKEPILWTPTNAPA